MQSSSLDAVPHPRNIMKNYLSMFLAVALTGCSAREDVGTPHNGSATVPVMQKASAPVDVEVLNLGATHARIKLTSERRATGVTVQVYGVDGLKVLSAETPIQKQDFAPGASQLLDVSFEPGAGLSHIAIHIAGEFDSIAAVRATNIQVGADAIGAAKSRVEHSVVETDSRGQRVHVTPASVK